MRHIQKFLMLLGFLTLAGICSAQSAAPYVSAGNQLLAAKDYAKAAQYYEAAVKMDPNNAPAQQGLGNCRYYLGDKVGALSAYEKALAIDPSNASLSSFVQTLRAQVGAPPPAAPASPALSNSPEITTPSFTPSTKPMAKKSSFEVDVMMGVALSLSSGYGLGFGGSVAGRMPMGQGLSIGGEIGFHTFGSSVQVPDGLGGFVTESDSTGSLSILGSVKYSISGMTGLKPYLIGGLGISMLMDSISYPSPYDIFNSSSSSAYLMAQAGGGISFPMGKDMDIFGEIKADVVIGGNGTFTYIPIGGGLAFNL